MKSKNQKREGAIERKQSDIVSLEKQIVSIQKLMKKAKGDEKALELLDGEERIKRLRSKIAQHERVILETLENIRLNSTGKERKHGAY